MNPTLAQGCDYLLELADRGLKYSAINTARSALSAMVPQYDGHSFGASPEVVMCQSKIPQRGDAQGFGTLSQCLNFSRGRNCFLLLKLLMVGWLIVP